MRGEVLDYAAGEGLISGEDGSRYTFTDADIVRRDGPIRAGVKVDFIAEGDKATRIYLLGSASRFETTNEDLTLWGYFVKCMRLYANGDGRARRKEYWSFTLFQFLFAIAAIILIAVPVAIATAESDDLHPIYAMIVVLCLAYLGAFLVPSVAVLVRRLHDIGMSGWFVLFAFVPYIGGLFAFIVALIPSQEEVNRYGKYPKPRAPYPV